MVHVVAGDESDIITLGPSVVSRVHMTRPKNLLTLAKSSQARDRPLKEGLCRCKNSQTERMFTQSSRVDDLTPVVPMFHYRGAMIPDRDCVLKPAVDP